MIAVMQAHVDGKPIERRGLASPQWVRVEAPNWDWSDCEYRIAPIAPGHNPKGLTVAQVGDGYRLLDEDEVGGRYGEERSLRGIECFLPDRTWDASGWWGTSKEYTFRTKLSREELARLRESWRKPNPQPDPDDRSLDAYWQRFRALPEIPDEACDLIEELLGELESARGQLEGWV